MSLLGARGVARPRRACRARQRTADALPLRGACSGCPLGSLDAAPALSRGCAAVARCSAAPPLPPQARSPSTASSPSLSASSCSSSSAVARMPTPSPQVPPPLPLPLPPRALPGRAAPCARRPPAGARAEGARARSPGAGLATAAIGNGLAFVVLVYATAGISGGHLNPAISTAFVVTGRCQTLAPPPPDALPPQTVAYRCCAPGARRAPRAAVADTGPSTRARARRSLGKQRYACYCVAQVLGAIFGALALKLALPPAMDETPFTTTGSLTFSHPFQVAPPRASSRTRPASAGVSCDAVVFAQVFFLEFVCTFTLVYCVFATAVDKSGGEPLSLGGRGRARTRAGLACSGALAPGSSMLACSTLQPVPTPAVCDWGGVNSCQECRAAGHRPGNHRRRLRRGALYRGQYEPGTHARSPLPSPRAALLCWRDASLQSCSAVCVRSQACRAPPDSAGAGVGLGWRMLTCARCRPGLCIRAVQARVGVSVVDHGGRGVRRADLRQALPGRDPGLAPRCGHVTVRVSLAPPPPHLLSVSVHRHCPHVPRASLCVVLGRLVHMLRACIAVVLLHGVCGA